jgi:hypothetical protein
MNKRKITTRIIFDGVIDNTFTQMRQVYTDEKGEYVNCNRNRYYIKNDKDQLALTKLLVYSIMCALMTVVSLIVIVVLF